MCNNSKRNVAAFSHRSFNSITLWGRFGFFARRESIIAFSVAIYCCFLSFMSKRLWLLIKTERKAIGQLILEFIFGKHKSCLKFKLQLINFLCRLKLTVPYSTSFQAIDQHFVKSKLDVPHTISLQSIDQRFVQIETCCSIFHFISSYWSTFRYIETCSSIFHFIPSFKVPWRRLKNFIQLFPTFHVITSSRSPKTQLETSTPRAHISIQLYFRFISLTHSHFAHMTQSRVVS